MQMKWQAVLLEQDKGSPGRSCAAFLLVFVSRHEINVDVCTQTQQAVNGRATQHLFPAPSRWLPQYNMRDLVLARHFHQPARNIRTAGANYLGTQILREDRVLVHLPLRRFPQLLCISSILKE